MAATHYQIFCRYYHSAVNKAVINDINVAQPVGWRQKEDLINEKHENRTEEIPDPDRPGKKMANPKYRYHTGMLDYYMKELGWPEDGKAFSSEKMTINSGFEDKIMNPEVDTNKLFFRVDKDYLDSDVCEGGSEATNYSKDGKHRYTYMAIENVWIRYEDYLLATDEDTQAANLSSARALDARLNEIITEEASNNNPKYDMIFIYDGIAQENAAKAINCVGNKITTAARKWTYYGNKLWKLPKKYRQNNYSLMTYFNPDAPTDIAVDIATERYSKDPYYYTDQYGVKINRDSNGDPKPIGLVAEEGVVSNIDFSEGIKVIVDPEDFKETYNIRENTTDDYAPITNVKLFTFYAYKESSTEKVYKYVYTHDEVPSIGGSGQEHALSFFLSEQDATDLLLGTKSSLTVKVFKEVENTGDYDIWTANKTIKLIPENFVKVNSSIGDLEVYAYKTETTDSTDDFTLEEASGLPPKVYYERFKRFEFSPWFVYSNCGSLKQALAKAEELVNIVGIDNLIIGKVVDLTQYIELA